MLFVIFNHIIYGLPAAYKDKFFLCPCYGSVKQIAVLQIFIYTDYGHNNNGKFTALTFMNGNGIGVLKILGTVKRKCGYSVIKPYGKLTGYFINIFKQTDIPVENSAAVFFIGIPLNIIVIL